MSESVQFEYELPGGDIIEISATVVPGRPTIQASLYFPANQRTILKSKLRIASLLIAKILRPRPTYPLTWKDYIIGLTVGSLS